MYIVRDVPEILLVENLVLGRVHATNQRNNKKNVCMAVQGTAALVTLRKGEAVTARQHYCCHMFAEACTRTFFGTMVTLF